MSEQDISSDARVVLSTFFYTSANSSLKLRMQESRPTERTQAALDELVSKSLITKEKFNDFGAIKYTGTKESCEIARNVTIAEVEKSDLVLAEPIPGK